MGADKLSRFFKLIRIEKMVGVSPSALRSQLQQMEQLLPPFQTECEQQVKQQPRKVVVAMDETFFGDFLILVLMDLRSGYLLLEEISDDRCFETGHAKTGTNGLSRKLARRCRRFSLIDSGIHTAKSVEAALENRAQAFQRIAHDQAIADKKDRLTKFRNQIQALAVTIDFWWLWVRDTLQGLEVNPMLKDWLTTTLLPVVYWHHQ